MIFLIMKVKFFNIGKDVSICMEQLKLRDYDETNEKQEYSLHTEGEERYMVNLENSRILQEIRIGLISFFVNLKEKELSKSEEDEFLRKNPKCMDILSKKLSPDCMYKCEGCANSLDLVMISTGIDKNNFEEIKKNHFEWEGYTLVVKNLDESPTLEIDDESTCTDVLLNLGGSKYNLQIYSELENLRIRLDVPLDILNKVKNKASQCLGIKKSNNERCNNLRKELFVITMNI